MHGVFSRPSIVFSLAIGMRIWLLLYGLWHDAHSPLKYTDIDYLVFTDAARFVSAGQPPYARETYRYTPLLAWLLWPTTWGPWWFAYGKVLFAAGDIVAGWLMVQTVQQTHDVSRARALRFASVWLLNPMVATISTRGSAEGLLGALVVAVLWAVVQRRIALAGVLLAVAVHVKIYPLIYAASLWWWLDETHSPEPCARHVAGSPVAAWWRRIKCCFNRSRLTLAGVSLLVFAVLNGLMYLLYGHEFLQHTYLYHVTRLDHRHNFSPYNLLLYLSSTSSTPSHQSPESLAFLPQLFLALLAVPLALAKKDLPSTMLAQTFAFVTFNKVCTSQYFLWYLVFLPFYLPRSSLLSSKPLGVTAALLWLSTQAVWLHQAFQLEFLGISTFMPGLWLSSIVFFLVNSGILGIIVLDIGLYSELKSKDSETKLR